jgi:flagellar motor switch protein FliM
MPLKCGKKIHVSSKYGKKINVSLKYSKKIHVSLKYGKKKGTLHENLHVFMTIFCLILLRMRNVSDKSYIEIKNTHFT